MIDCIFSKPEEIYEGQWQYSEMQCSDFRSELITNESENFFYIRSEITLGELLISTGLFLIVGMFLLKVIFGFFFPHIIKFTKKWS